MSFLTRFLNLFRRASLNQEFDEEIRFHLEASIATYEHRGLTQEEAEAEASRRFGSIEKAKRQMQEVRIMKRAVTVGALAVLSVSIAAVAWIWSRPGESRHTPSYYRATDVGIAPPRVVRERRPYYPEEAKLAKVQGEVFMECTVRPDGICSDIQVTKSLDPMWLDREAIRTLEEWRFSPGTLRGEPVPVRVNVEFRFTLR